MKLIKFETERKQSKFTQELLKTTQERLNGGIGHSLGAYISGIANEVYGNSNEGSSSDGCGCGPIKFDWIVNHNESMVNVTGA